MATTSALLLRAAAQYAAMGQQLTSSNDESGTSVENEWCYRKQMLDLTQLALYAAAAFLLAITPGPGISYVAARALAGGRTDGVASSLGTGLGGMVHVIAGSMGVSAIVLASAELFSTLKLIGAAYLVWLGIRTIQSARYDAADINEKTSSVGAHRAVKVLWSRR